MRILLLAVGLIAGALFALPTRADEPKRAADSTNSVESNVAAAPVLAAEPTLAAPVKAAEPAEPVEASPSDIPPPAAPAPSAAAPQPCVSQPCEQRCSGLRPQDQFWLIETGHLPCVDCQAFAPPALQYYQHDCEQGWVVRASDDFFGGARDALTVFYVPGNRVADDEAVRRGWMVYHSLAAAADSQPLRLVVWSWPSEKVQLGIRDFRAKASRTPTESLYLGWTLSQLPTDARLSLVGFSYGARIISGALHAVESGELNGIGLPGFVAAPDRKPARVVLLAAAMHNYWMIPGQRHGAALARVDRLILIYNSCDNALQRYPRLDRCEPGAALGQTGFVHAIPEESGRDRVRQFDACCLVGKQHAELSYLGSSQVIGSLQQYALWNVVAE